MMGEGRVILEAQVSGVLMHRRLPITLLNPISSVGK